MTNLWTRALFQGGKNPTHAWEKGKEGRDTLNSFPAAVTREPGRERREERPFLLRKKESEDSDGAPPTQRVSSAGQLPLPKEKRLHQTEEKKERGRVLQIFQDGDPAAHKNVTPAHAGGEKKKETTALDPRRKSRHQLGRKKDTRFRWPARKKKKSQRNRDQRRKSEPTGDGLDSRGCLRREGRGVGLETEEIKEAIEVPKKAP